MTTSSTTQDLLFEVSGGIARVTINRPEARECIHLGDVRKASAVLRGVDANDSIRVLIITGAGEKAFSAGTDISAFRTSGLRRMRLATRPSWSAFSERSNGAACRRLRP